MRASAGSVMKPRSIRFAQHLLDDGVGGAGRDHELDVGVGRAQTPQHRRQQVGQRRHARTKMDAPDAAVLVATHGSERAVRLGYHAPAVLDQVASGRGRERTLPHAFDEGDAEAALELANLQANRGLRQVQPASCFGEAARLGDLREGAKLIEAQATHIKINPYGCDLNNKLS